MLACTPAHVHAADAAQGAVQLAQFTFRIKIEARLNIENWGRRTGACGPIFGGMHNDRKRMTAAGFTLVESLTVVAIVAILTSIGVPTFRTITTSSRVSTEVNALLSDVQYARSEALKQGQRVTTCISTDQETCTGGALWQGGWIVFSDTNGNATVDGTDAVLRVQKAFSRNDTFQDATGIGAITFNRAGFALNLPGAGALLVLHDVTQNVRYTRCLSIALAGMAITQTHTSAPATCT